jgi:CxxC motif-containing protein (DUF1111 family)
MANLRILRACILTSMVLAASTALSTSALAQSFNASDPGLRGGAAGAGDALPGLTTTNADGSPGGEFAFFDLGKDDFAEAEEVADGIGPRFNLDSCGGCHAQPATGGSSPAVNPQFALAVTGPFDAGNRPPSFITRNGPVREARFVKNHDGTPDGGVHALFVITGAPGATGCNIKQEDFEAQVAAKNIIFRIPTPVFGAGMIEAITDSTLRANVAANSSAKSQLGISGRLNTNGNDGTVTRFGWKAQNKSLLIFSGEAYNVEMGITNGNFQQEREEDPNCQFGNTPNSDQSFDTKAGFPGLIQSIDNFANFQRFLDQPKPVTASFTTTKGRFVSSQSIANGKQVFSAIGCNLCHTPSLTTSAKQSVAALRGKTANLYSDVAVHNMGVGLADNVSQGGANGNEFRTAPLWGVGQRIFFLHDGRTSDIEQAIKEHASSGSEANGVIGRFNTLGEGSKQDLFNFLRSL